MLDGYHNKNVFINSTLETINWIHKNEELSNTRQNKNVTNGISSNRMFTVKVLQF